MKIFALLVGINNYPGNPLHQCVNDTLKFKAYLESLTKAPYLLEVNTKLLHDEDATKTSITGEIETFLGQAGDDDVAIFYYSGHGAYENAEGRSQDENNGLLECIVCHYEKDQDSGFLLADKELRYILQEKTTSEPHLVTVFDCCHSGNMVRAIDEDIESDQIKRLNKRFEARDYTEFLFHHKISENDLKTKPTSVNFPFKNHVHLAACSSSQSSWEDNKGGVFTRYLLQLLRSRSNKINYKDIARWAKISLKDITNKKQSPTYSIQGKGKMTAYSPWLNLHQEAIIPTSATITQNDAQGWYLNMGKLMGIKAGTLISINDIKNEKGKNIQLKVEEADIELSLLEDPIFKGIDLEQKEYAVTVNSVYSKLSLFVNNIDGTPDEKEQLKDIIQSNEKIELTSAGAADFYINIFNELVYCSLPGNPFRPLGLQIDLIENADTLEIMINDQLKHLIKWNHFNTLENPDKSFDTSPIRVEFNIKGTNEWHDVSNGEYLMTPRKERLTRSRLWGQAFQIKVTNISDETIYVSALSLGSNMGISASPFDGKVIELKKGDYECFYKHRKDSCGFLFLDPYMEVYNWKEEWLHYKFIVNNYENFGTSIEDFIQPGLSKPMVLNKISGMIERHRGESDYEDWEEVINRWGTLKTTIRLKNPEYNIISADLKEAWEHYQNSEEIAPFLNMLYIDNQLNGLINKSSSLPNRTGEEENEKSIGGIKKHLGNFLDNQRRKRKFKKARKKMIDKPVIVAEGDSWFLYPFLVKDIIDYVMEEFPVRSIAAAGDELQNYKKEGQLLKEVAKIRPKYVLISGGGNDIIGPEIQNILAENIPTGSKASDYVNDTFYKNMQKLEAFYSYFVQELKKHESVKQVFFHGYDYIRTDHKDKFINSGWVNKYMNIKGITNAKDRDRVIRFLIDTFNGILHKISKDDPFVTYLNLRGKVLKGQWFDEIHPNDIGNKTLGDFFIDAINAVQNKIS